MREDDDMIQTTIRIPAYLKARLDAEVDLNKSSQSSEVIRLMRAAWKPRPARKANVDLVR
jgi:Arc/MetJ-type ribon-helix-helix transcriptional regulator